MINYYANLTATIAFYYSVLPSAVTSNNLLSYISHNDHLELG